VSGLLRPVSPNGEVKLEPERCAMFGTKQGKGGIADAVAAARDEALVEIGREASLRQRVRQAESRRTSTGGIAVAALAASAALAAGAVVYRARKRKNGKGGVLTNGNAPPTNGTVSEHEHEEHADEPATSRR
jgi:hypothetical protein